MKYNVFTPLRNLYRKNTAILGRVGTGEIRVSIFRDQKGIADTLEVLSNVDSSRENFVDRSAVTALRDTTINFQILSYKDGIEYTGGKRLDKELLNATIPPLRPTNLSCTFLYYYLRVGLHYPLTNQLGILYRY